MGKRIGGRFASSGVVPPCPFDHHRGSRVRSFGSRQRKDGTWVYRYSCVWNGESHTFSECFTEDPPPVFSPAKCPQGHRGKVIRKGTNNKNGTRHQRYRCQPADGSKAHTFTQKLPRQRVPQDPNWTDADAVKNPHRGPVASGRGHEFTMRVVAEGLQRLSQGEAYASVGRWAAGQKTARLRTVATTKQKGKNFWQTGASWVELYSPVLWEAWQAELVDADAAATASPLPRVLVIDDVPVFGDDTEDGVTSQTMLYSVLAAVEYHPARLDPNRYDHRVRTVRAYPQHTGDAYELLVYDSGFLPDVIVADSAHGIVKAIKRLRAYNPDLVWVPSAWHVVAQLRRAMSKLTNPRLASPFVPGDLLTRMESMSFLADEVSWDQWWSDLDRRMNAQAIPANLRPNAWRKTYDAEMRNALRYLAVHTQVPRGNGALEAAIRNEVTPFFAGRAQRFANIERVNRACDLLTLRLNGKLNRPADIEKTLTAAAVAGDGWMPPARQVNDPERFSSLRSREVLEQTLAQAREDAHKRWGAA